MSEALLPDLPSAFPLSDFVPATPHQTPVTRSTFFAFLKSLWERICSVATKIFSNISYLCRTKNFFSSHEVTLLRDERPIPPAEVLNSDPLKDKKVTVVSTQHNEEPKGNQEPVYLTFDPALENLRSFIRDFASLGVNFSYEAHVVNHVESAQRLAPSLPPFIKSISKLLVEMGDKAAKPLFKKFAEQKAQTIDPALQKIFKTLLKPEIEHPTERRNLYDSLHEILTTEFKDTKIPLKISLESDYIAPVLNWLLLSDHTTPLNDLFIDLTPQKEELLDKIFERCISLLVEKKIDEYSHILEKIMQRRLGEIVQHALQKNAVRIADFFSERLSELIHEIPFPDTFDTLIHDTLHLQIQGIIESEKHFEECRQTLEKSYQIAQIEPKTEEALDAQVRAQNHIKTVEMYGGAEAYLQMTYLEKLREHPCCSLHLKQIVDEEKLLIKSGKDPRVVRSSVEKALYATIAENFLNLMTPVRKKLNEKGEVVEIDPFMELWDRLYLPEEFHDLIKQSEQLTQEFVTPETTILLEKIRQPTVEIIKSLFKSTTKDLLRKKIEEIIKNGIEKITIPEKINELGAETILPSVNMQLIETLASQTVEKNIKEFTPLFYEMICSDPKDRHHHLRTLQHTLIKLTKNKFNLFNPSNFYTHEEKVGNKYEIRTSGLTPQDWLELTENVVLDIEMKIVNSNTIPSNISFKEMSEILKKTFVSDSKENNKKFGNLTTDLIFKLGKFSNEWLINFFVKDSLSASLTEAVKPWRESHAKLIDTVANNLKKKIP